MGNAPFQDLKSIDQVNYEQSLSILEGSDPEHAISYTNTKGHVFNNTIRDVLYQVISHSTYHRGQIAAEFRQNGLDPLATDYIVYKRG